MRLLLVEDDWMIGDSTRQGLRQDGFAVDWVRDAESAGHALQGEPYDLLLLDLGLPDKPGLELLRELRGRGNDVPVLILTARDAVSDRVGGLDLGADDYLIKPFDLDELAARVRALLRRRVGRSEPRIRHGALTLDPAAHEVTLHGRLIHLSAREFALLQVLLEQRGRVLSRARLEQRLYGWEEEVESNAVEVHVHHLRKKLGASLIHTVRGVGYTVVPEP